MVAHIGIGQESFVMLIDLGPEPGEERVGRH